jgi:hypothetical protein
VQDRCPPAARVHLDTAAAGLSRDGAPWRRKAMKIFNRHARLITAPPERIEPLHNRILEVLLGNGQSAA